MASYGTLEFTDEFLESILVQGLSTPRIARP